MADEQLLFPCTHGAEAPERATVPYIAAATAAASGQRAIVVLTIDGIWTGVPGHHTDDGGGIEVDGMPTLADLQAGLVAGGGEIWLCSACATKRGITGDTELVPGARIVGAATIVEALTTGRAISLG